MHTEMALNIEECVELTHLKNKTTAVIPTSESSIEFLVWSVFSLLLRSKPKDLLEHICVCINGPDLRTGDDSLQNKKQEFLEDLRNIPWYHMEDTTTKTDMPITVIRAWSRVDWSEPMEMALPWIHTDSYIIMHDDVIIKTPDWQDEVKKKFYNDDNVAIAYTELFGCKCDHAIHKGMYLLRLPQLQSTFLVCKKKWIMKAGVNWSGYQIPSDYNFLQFNLNENEIENEIDVEEFVQYYTKKGLINKEIQKNELYNFVRQDIGAWIYYKLSKNNNSFVELDNL